MSDNTILGMIFLSLVQKKVHSKVGSLVWYDTNKKVFMLNDTPIGDKIGPALRYMERKGWENA